MFRYLIVGISLVFVNSLLAQPANLDLLREKTQKSLSELAQSSRGVMGFCAVDLIDGTRFALHENLVFPQASAIKITILMEVYKQAQDGKLKLTDLREIRKDHKVGGTGILNDLSGEGVRMSIRDLCVLMIVLSDNSATNILIDLVGREKINLTLDSLGFKETRLRRRMMDTAASHRGDENTSTPDEAVRIMQLLYKGEFLNRAACDDILSILKKGKTTSLAAGLPTDVAIACKPGGIAGVNTEWAIVYVKNRPFAVAVMENYGMGDAPSKIADFARELHNYFARMGKATSHGALVDRPKP